MAHNFPVQGIYGDIDFSLKPFFLHLRGTAGGGWNVYIARIIDPLTP